MNVSIKTVKNVLFVLTEMVEKAIAKELAAAKVGALMYNAWNKASVHYMGLFASYLQESSIVHGQKSVIKWEPTCTLLSAAPMVSPLNLEDGNDKIN